MTAHTPHERRLAGKEADKASQIANGLEANTIRVTKLAARLAPLTADRERVCLMPSVY